MSLVHLRGGRTTRVLVCQSSRADSRQGLSIDHQDYLEIEQTGPGPDDQQHARVSRVNAQINYLSLGREGGKWRRSSHALTLASIWSVTLLLTPLSVFASLCLCLSLGLRLSLSLCLSLSVSLCLCLSLCLTLSHHLPISLKRGD
jgi:hypothetical protein